MSPIPPPGGMAGASFFSGISVIMHSVVSKSEAIEAAFCNATTRTMPRLNEYHYGRLNLSGRQEFRFPQRGRSSLLAIPRFGLGTTRNAQDPDANEIGHHVLPLYELIGGDCSHNRNHPEARVRGERGVKKIF
jgi:hypothetical protein